MPAARAAGPYAANTPAPIIDPSPMNTASPRPSRRSSDAETASRRSSNYIAAAIRRPASAICSLGRRRQHVLPRHQLRAAHVEPPERPRHEPDVEVRAAVAPAVEVDPTRRRPATARPARPDRTRRRRSRRRRPACRRRSRSGRATASQTEPGEPGLAGVVQGPGARRTRSGSPSESALHGKQGSPPASPRRGGSGTTRSAGSIRVSGSAYGSVMPRASADARSLPLDRGCRPAIKSGRTTRQPRATPCRRFTDSRVGQRAVAQDRVVGELDAVDDPGRVEDHDLVALLGVLGLGAVTVTRPGDEVARAVPDRHRVCGSSPAPATCTWRSNSTGPAASRAAISSRSRSRPGELLGEPVGSRAASGTSS